MLAWVVTAFGSVMLALVFAHLSRRNPAAGGVYAYTREAFGDFAGFLVAWGYWISVWSANASLAIAFVGYAGPLLTSLSPSMPNIANTPALAASMAIGVVWFLTAVNMIGIRTAGKVQVATTALKILPLIIVGAGGVFAFNSAHFAIPDPATVSFGAALLAAMTQTLFAFLGLEVATIPASAVQNPDKTIPRATVIGTVATAGIYIASTAGAMSLVAPEALSKSTAPFADAARVLGGGGLSTLVAVGAAISAFGALNGWILAVGQLALAAARDGLFPRAFGRLSSRGLPATAMIITAALASALIALNYSNSTALVEVFTKTLVLSTLATLIPYSFCSLAVFIPGGGRAKAVGAGITTIALLAFVYSMFAIYGAGAETVFLGFLLVMAGLPVYVWVVRQKNTADDRS
jgi:APA family basic amino acid/polyamine antiporter